MKKGKIVLVKFPFTDFSSTKRRPALVVSEYDKESRDLIVAFISSNTTNEISSSDILIWETDEDFPYTGLHKSSIIKLDKIMTIEKKLLAGELGNISLKRLKEVNKKLRTIFGI